MKKTQLGLILSIVLLSSCASTEVKKDPIKTTNSPNLTDAQIKMLIVGKTMLGDSIGGNSWTAKINSNGTISGTTGTSDDNGTFTIKDNKLCNKWNNWRSGAVSCWTMRKRTNDYFAKLVSGSSSSFKFTVK